MSLKTVVKNTSSLRDCDLDEANAGVSRHLARLKKNGGKHEITCNPNATYREYWVASDLATLDLQIITTDECIENSEIIIEDDGSNGLKIKRVPRDSMMKADESSTSAASSKRASWSERCRMM